MTHGSLFSGIGGFDLAAEWMGWQNIFHCEWNPFGQKVLKHYWPNSISYNDITKTDFTIHAGAIDILTGGFPCQPYSAAGKRLGKEDERHLWPEMLRAIREISPRYVVGENVRGLTNWNGGMVFDEVQADLEAAGYEVLPFLLPAAGVNAPHRRDRIFFVAYAESAGKPKRINGWEKYQQVNRTEIWSECNTTGESRPTSNTESIRKRSRANGKGKNERSREQLERSEQGCNSYNDGISWNGSNSECKGLQRRREQWQRFKQGHWDKWPQAEPAICGRDDGFSNGLDGITFSKWRNESIKAYGNAIVPQVAYQIFKTIQKMEEL